MAVSELPGNPNAVWTVRRHVDGNACCVHRVLVIGGVLVKITFQAVVPTRGLYSSSIFYLDLSKLIKDEVTGVPELCFYNPFRLRRQAKSLQTVLTL